MPFSLIILSPFLCFFTSFLSFLFLRCHFPFSSSSVLAFRFTSLPSLSYSLLSFTIVAFHCPFYPSLSYPRVTVLFLSYPVPSFPTCRLLSLRFNSIFSCRRLQLYCVDHFIPSYLLSVPLFFAANSDIKATINLLLCLDL